MRHLSPVWQCCPNTPRYSTHLQFPELAALARMSYKYQISHIFEMATRSLRQMFPGELALWEDQSRNIRGHAVEAVNLFRLLNEPHMLVPALYECSLLSSREVFRGTPRADGTLERLTPADMELCWDMHHSLMAQDACMVARFLAPFRASPGSACQSPDECARIIEEELLSEERDDATCIPVEYVRGNPLYSYYVERINSALSNKGVCEWCMKELLHRERNSREEIWERLPNLTRTTGIARGSSTQ